MIDDTLVGKFATSKAGHDRSHLYVIVAVEGDFVFLCDGRLKTVEKPKKKRRKHIQPIQQGVGEELLGKLCSGDRLFDEEIKFAIRQYNQTI